tara:strand:+ start:343 stop:588 length:246 start_codon:yes stop_codon:yes gene_type:complete
MKSFLVLSIIIFSFTNPAYSYPESQMDECISSALSNPATKTISKLAIKNYCDCALKAIIDENKDIRESGYTCAQINFNESR